MTRIYAAMRYKMMSSSISASFRDRAIQTSGRRPIYYRPIFTSHPYFIRGEDMEVFSRTRKVNIHLTAQASQNQKLFDHALAFFSSFVRNQMFSASNLATTPYVNELFIKPVEVEIDGTSYTYSQYSSERTWRETLALNGNIVARANGELQLPYLK